jgi:aminoglycoside phosphotransferase family enzyme/predicted kinase
MLPTPISELIIIYRSHQQPILIQSLTAGLEDTHAKDKPARNAVKCFETHLSWVLVAGGFAYKIKKALHFDFVDFSTLAARRFYCEKELKLNRRLAPDLYLSVEAITGSVDQPVIGGSGLAIDYLVKMRAFDQAALWSARVANRSLSAAEVDSLVKQIACFHRVSDRAPQQSTWSTAQTIKQTADDNLSALSTLTAGSDAAGMVQELLEWQHNLRLALRQTFDNHKIWGFVRECHGDLHTGNVMTLNEQACAFDCIEFSEALRWIDVMNDIAFMYMDLECLGLPALAARLLDGYLSETGDYTGLAVLRYYHIERALIRAKVCLIRAAQHRAAFQDCAAATARTGGSGNSDLGLGPALQYLKFAIRATASPVAAIMITHGFSGSGKSTFSQILVELTGAVRLRSDIERKRLNGIVCTNRNVVPVVHGMYAPALSEATYAHLLALTREVVAAGYAVIIDAAFLKKHQRTAFRELSEELSVPFFLFDLQAHVDILRRRLAARQHLQSHASDADIAVLEYQIATEEQLTGGEEEVRIVINGEKPFDTAEMALSCETVLQRLGIEKPVG